ncbi:1281_t:CDS:1, partial [Gigaspora rosea]
ATPIGETTNVQNEFDEDLDEERNDMEPPTLENWETQLRNWEQILIDEEVARLEGEEEERDNYYDNMGSDLLSNYTHPAIDERAKWDLASLFSVLFQKPDYMNNNN